MATVTTPYALVDGATLDADQYNDDIYDPSVAGRGIVSEPNGRLDGTNLAGGFLLQAEHIQPGELYRTKLAYDLDSQDYYDDASAIVNESDDAGPTRFVPVFGAACRIYIPFPALVLWQWTYFMHPWRASINDWAAGTGARNLEGFTVTNIGGAIVNHTQRRLTFSVLLQNDGITPSSDFGATANGLFSLVENRSPQHYSLHHAEAVTTSGYRDLSVRLFLEDSDEAFVIRRDIHGTLSGAGEWTHNLHTRVTFGIKSAMAIAYHFPA